MLSNILVLAVVARLLKFLRLIFVLSLMMADEPKRVGF